MSDDSKFRSGAVPAVVDWPEDLLKDPEYPVLEETVIDLASDAIVFKAPFNPNDF